MYEEKIVLCGANSYEKRFYLNPDFAALPETIQNELKVMCVFYTEDVGGILTLVFDENGELCFEVTTEENDFMFDEIGSRLKIKELQNTKGELLESLQLFYKVFFLGEELLMLFVIDVGNTHITLGVFDGKELKATFRMTAKQPRTSDEYGIQLCDLLVHRNFNVKDIEDVIVSSVVPDIMHSLGSAIIKYFNVRPIVPSTLDMGLTIHTEHPKEIGPDRIVDAVAAYEKYGGPVIVIDFGTATTYDVVTEDGVFEGGLISTGIRTAARALWGGAAMLPEIEIRKPGSIIAKETVSSMQGGLVFGYIGQVEYIVNKMKAAGYENAKVVATGGLGNIIVPETDAIDIYDPNLTLEGLRIIYEKHKEISNR